MKWCSGILLLLLCLLLACKPAPPPEAQPLPQPTATPTSSSSTSPLAKLSWESGKPERSKWSAHLQKRISEQIQVFSAASNLESFCTNFASLSTPKQVQVISELFVRVSKWESSFNPKTTFQEPPPPKGPGTLSIGLFQMSYGDGSKCPNSKAQGDLMDPLVNIDCAVNKAVALIKANGVIVGENPRKGMSRYWSVVWQHKHLPDIKAHTQRICVP